MGCCSPPFRLRSFGLRPQDDREGGWDDRKGGWDEREGGWDDEEGGWDDEEGGRDDREGRWDDREGRWDDRGGWCSVSVPAVGHGKPPTAGSAVSVVVSPPFRLRSFGLRPQDDREGGWDDREGGWDDREGGWDDREGGWDDEEGGWGDREGWWGDREGWCILRVALSGCVSGMTGSGSFRRNIGVILSAAKDPASHYLWEEGGCLWDKATILSVPVGQSRSRLRYWIASAIWGASIVSAAARSAMVRATLMIRSWARMESPRFR